MVGLQHHRRGHNGTCETPATDLVHASDVDVPEAADVVLERARRARAAHDRLRAHR
jgi:hypothetical protein